MKPKAGQMHILGLCRGIQREQDAPNTRVILNGKF
jgi:hypothetical protein